MSERFYWKITMFMVVRISAEKIHAYAGMAAFNTNIVLDAASVFWADYPTIIHYRPIKARRKYLLGRLGPAENYLAIWESE